MKTLMHIAFAAAVFAATFANAGSVPGVTVMVGNTGYAMPIPPEGETYELFNGDYIVHDDGTVEVMNEHETGATQVRVSLDGVLNERGKAYPDNCWVWADPVGIGETGTYVKSGHHLDENRRAVEAYELTITYTTDDGVRYYATGSSATTEAPRDGVFGPRNKSGNGPWAIHRLNSVRNKISNDVRARTASTRALARRRKAVAKKLDIPESEVPSELLVPVDIPTNPGDAARQARGLPIVFTRPDEQPYQEALDKAFEALNKAIYARADELGVRPNEVPEKDIDPALLRALDDAEKALDEYRRQPPPGFTVATPNPPGFVTVAERKRRRKIAERRKSLLETR